MPGATNLFENESYFLVQIYAKGYQSGTHTSEIKFAQFVFNDVFINENKYIHQYEDTDHVYAIVRTSPRATHVVCAGDLVPADNMLVTPALCPALFHCVVNTMPYRSSMMSQAPVMCFFCVPLNASFHVGGPLTAGALRPVPHGPHS